MKWLAIRATESEIQAAFRGAGVEVIGEGDAKALGAFLESTESAQESWGLVWLQEGPIAQLANLHDAAFLALAEGEPSVAIASDSRLLATLVDMAATQVAEKGGCLLDLREFGLSADTARVIAERAGLNVVIGLKALFTPRDEMESSVACAAELSPR
ncbi:MAG TPA: hypothetical protein VKK31_18345 [Thermoanaerobaculia bacterium]|nr:hypothetical protein [Thermoanaerobaculia bacterium]